MPPGDSRIGEEIGQHGSGTSGTERPRKGRTRQRIRVDRSQGFGRSNLISSCNFRPTKRYGGSVWESNLLGAHYPSTYEEGLGRNRKDLASVGTANAAFLPPRFFIPLFSLEEPFRRLDCWPPASHRAPPVCRCSSLCECPNGAEVLAEPS